MGSDVIEVLLRVPPDEPYEAKAPQRARGDTRSLETNQKKSICRAYARDASNYLAQGQSLSAFSGLWYDGRISWRPRANRLGNDQSFGLHA